MKKFLLALNITIYSILLPVLFLGGLVLLVCEIDIYRNTFISYPLPTAIWLITGLLTTPLFGRILSIRYNTPGFFLQFIYCLCSWGSITVYLFMALNFYFTHDNKTWIQRYDKTWSGI